MKKYEYASLEWVWDLNSIRINFAKNREKIRKGTYPEVINALTELGLEGWEVATCAAQGNWLFWTLKRETDGFLDQPPSILSGDQAPIDN